MDTNKRKPVMMSDADKRHLIDGLLRQDNLAGVVSYLSKEYGWSERDLLYLHDINWEDKLIMMALEEYRI